MKLGIICLAAIFVGCGPKIEPVQQNSNTAPMRAEKLQSTIEHTTENQPPTNANTATGPKTKWTQSGDPIDTAKFDGVINQAEKAVKAKPSDDAGKKVLAQAYFDRGFALTEARQYASALGDYRRALKYDPSNEDAQKWIDQIIGIYGMLKKDYPKDGEEPPPLPWKGEQSEKGKK
jgi:tetratricopeptide (TPR) repeat protein